MKRGDRVQCSCAPKCSRSWAVAGAIVGKLPDGSVSYAPVDTSHPCIRGTFVRRATKRERAELGPGYVLVRQSHGGIKFYTPIGFGQYAGRTHAAEVWALGRTLVPWTDDEKKRPADEVSEASQ